jgi:hypothetical protein
MSVKMDKIDHEKEKITEALGIKEEVVIELMEDMHKIGPNSVSRTLERIWDRDISINYKIMLTMEFGRFIGTKNLEMDRAISKIVEKSVKSLKKELGKKLGGEFEMKVIKGSEAKEIIKKLEDDIQPEKSDNPKRWSDN